MDLDQYLADAPERVRELSAALGRLRVRDPRALDELQRRLEDLGTSAGSHGLAGIASRCAAARIAVSALRLRPLPLERADLTALEQHVLAIADGLRLALRPGTDPDPH